MANTLSTFLWFSLSVSVAAIAGTGCVDAKGSFDDFEGRVIDAANNTVDAPMVDMIPDVSGTFLWGLAPDFAPAATIRLIGTHTLTQNGDGTATLSVILQPVGVLGGANDGLPVGNALTVDNIAVDNTASFSFALTGNLPGTANPVSGTDLALDLTVDGNIRDMDTMCGLVNGSAGVAPLNNSTFGSMRITAGTMGNALPTALVTCPASPADAGMSDAGAADAGVADATAADAT